MLAAASGGGHWEQLMMLRPAFAAHDIRYATTDPAVAQRHGIEGAAILPDCNQHTPIKALACVLAAMLLVLRIRPHVVISTGAAPGFLCILAGRLVGARTLFVDSIANADELSLCGRLSKRLAHTCLTQWEHLAGDAGPSYRGALL